MRFFVIGAITLILGTFSSLAGTPAQAEAVQTAYAKDMEAFTIKLKLAKTEAERQKLMENAPDAVKASRAMWQVIRRDLGEEWTLEPAAWILEVGSKVVTKGDAGIPKPVISEEISAIKKAVSNYHIKSPELAPMCFGLISCGDPESLKILRTIEKENPDKKVSGTAALGIAILSKAFGDDPRVMSERLTMLRKAIINSADVSSNGVSVAELAEEELYLIMNLSKGRTAPDLEGVGTGGRSMKLSDYSGKVVLLVFWNSATDEGEGLIEWITALRNDRRFMGKPFEVVGVNSDPSAKLRAMEVEGKVNWPNFSDPANALGEQYRIQVWPTCLVLDKERKIQYIGSIGTFAELTAAALLSE